MKIKSRQKIQDKLNIVDGINNHRSAWHGFGADGALWVYGWKEGISPGLIARGSSMMRLVRGENRHGKPGYEPLRAALIDAMNNGDGGFALVGIRPNNWVDGSDPVVDHYADYYLEFERFVIDHTGAIHGVIKKHHNFMK